MDLSSLKSLYGTEGELEAGLQERCGATIQLGLSLFSFSFHLPAEMLSKGFLRLHRLFSKSLVGLSI